MTVRSLHRMTLPALLGFELVVAAAAASCGGSDQILGKTGSNGSGGSGNGGSQGNGASQGSGASTGVFSTGTGVTDGGTDGGSVNTTYPCTGCPACFRRWALRRARRARSGR